MNRPFDDDPFSHAPTEEISSPPRSRAPGPSGASRQPSSPGFSSQGPASQPGFASQSDQTIKRSPSQPGFSPSASSTVQDLISQPGLSLEDDQPDDETVPQLDFPPLADPFAPVVVDQPDPVPQNKLAVQEATPDLASQTLLRQGSAPVFAHRRPSSPEHPMPQSLSHVSELEASDTLLNTSPRNSASVPEVAEQPTTILPITHSPMPLATSSTTPQAKSSSRPEADSPTLHVTPPSRPEADLPTIPLATVHTAPPTPLTPPPASKKAHKKSGGVLVGVVVILALLVAGGGTLFALHLRSVVQSKGTPTVQVSPTTPSITPTVITTGTLKQPLQVGENWVVTVTKVTTTTNSDFPPQTGYTYLEISLSLKNVSANPQMLASLLQFTFTDATGKKYNEAAAITKDSNIQQTPDGTINSGQTLKAQLSYLVPQNQHTFTLSFEYDLIQGGSSAVTWQLNV